MKAALLSSDANHTHDPPSWNILRRAASPDLHPQNSDVVIIPIFKQSGFKFRDTLPDEIRDKRWVLVDYSEHGWDWSGEETLKFGENTERVYGGFYNEEWRKFDDFVRGNPPALTFCRELLKKDASDKILPIEYPNCLPELGQDSQENFLKRPLEVINVWGRSSEYRMYLHGAIFNGAPVWGYDVITEWSHIDKAVQDNPQTRKWASIHVPHYARIEVEEVQKHVRKAQVSMTPFGAGRKNFRHGEVCADTIMAMPDDGLAWSYPWNEDNSIQLNSIRNSSQAAKFVDLLDEATRRAQLLFPIYAAAMDNARNYQVNTYARRWILGNIEKNL